MTSSSPMPEAVRETPRLRLTPVSAKDAECLYALHRDPGVARWYAGEWTTRDEARERTADMERAWREKGVHKWLAHRREDGVFVGRGGCSWTVLEGREELELGWVLLEKYWGNGYATEIGRAGVEFGLRTLGAARVVSFTEVHNTRSRAVMERIGMERVGTVRLPGLVPGSWQVHQDAEFALYEVRRG